MKLLFWIFQKAAHLVLAFIQGMQKLEFLNDLKTQSSVLYQLMVMGEAVKRKSLLHSGSPGKPACGPEVFPGANRSAEQPDAGAAADRQDAASGENRGPAMIVADGNILVSLNC